MKRMRYSKPASHPDTFVSQMLLCGTELVYVVLHPATLSFTILKYDGQAAAPLYEGRANTLTMLKRKAKQALKELGVRFLDEIRNAGKTEKFEI